MTDILSDNLLKPSDKDILLGNYRSLDNRSVDDRFPSDYQAVVVNKTLKVEFLDTGSVDKDDDLISVIFNGGPPRSVFLTGDGETLTFNLRPGKNTLRVTALASESGLTTIGVRFPSNEVVAGDSVFDRNIIPTAVYDIDFGLPVIRIDGDRFPQAAQHIIDTLEEPQILTIDRPNDATRRRQSTGPWISENGPAPVGYDADEGLPAIFRENAGQTSVRAVAYWDNRGAGGSLGRQLESLKDEWNVDFFATDPPRGARNIFARPGGRPVTGRNGNSVIRGTSTRDLLRGDSLRPEDPRGGRDQIFGGAGDDDISGRGGDDVLVGQKGDDRLFGDQGNDVLFGGLGNDHLWGDDDLTSGADIFVLNKDEGFDIIKDFEIGKDLIGLSARTIESIGSIRRVQEGNDTVIIADGTSIGVVENVLPSQLSNSSFMLYLDISLPTIRP